MPHLELDDVEQIVRLLAEAGDPTIDRTIVDRKQMLLDGICKLIDGDVYMWSTFKSDPVAKDNVMPVSMVDGGWRDPYERAGLFEVLLNPKFVAGTHDRLYEAMGSHRHLTLLRDEAMSADVWSKHGQTWLATGFEQFVLSVYPLSHDCASAIAFHRRRNEQAFAERDRMIVHVIVQQVDWLHRHGSDVPAGAHVLALSPRERQVMLLLMHGESQKEIARQMQISFYTVGDYIKQIYKQFGVSSRAELLSQFISGGQR